MKIKTTSKNIICTSIHFNLNSNDCVINVKINENENSKIIIQDFFDNNEFVQFKKLNNKYHKGIEKIKKYDDLRKSLKEFI